MPDLILLERSLDPPISWDDLERMDREAAWCMEHHRVRHTTSLLSLDGRRLLCAFFAPDLEAVRNVLRQFEVVPVRLWAATAHGPPDHPVTEPLARNGDELVVVPRAFDEPVDPEAIPQVGERAAHCLERQRVRLVRSWLARDRRSVLYVYAAPDADSVRTALAALPLGDPWSARLFLSEA